jgi:hypothetical protein
MVPLATVAGAPRLLEAVPPTTLLREFTRKVPLGMVTGPLKELAPERTTVPPPVAALVRP